VLTTKNLGALVRGRQRTQEIVTMKTMFIKIIRPTIFRKEQVMPSDEPIEVTPQEAVDMIGAGKAVAVKDAEVENTDQPMAEVETSTTTDKHPDFVEDKPKSQARKRKRVNHGLP
jgi:hypothetical protein